MARPGLYANIHAKRKRGGKMRKKGAKGAPTAANFARAKQTVRKGMKKGGFPDLSGDGKTTMKDILIGRGVIKKGDTMNKKKRVMKRGGGMMGPKKKMAKGGSAKKGMTKDRMTQDMAMQLARARKPSGRLTADDLKQARAKMPTGRSAAAKKIANKKKKGK